MIYAVFLAAGRGKRFGGGEGDKLLYPVEGVTMGERVFRALPGEIPGVVVTGDSRVAALAHPHENLTVAALPEARDDVALSIRTGLRALPEEAEGALFFVCDQPWLTEESVRRLVAAFRADPEKICVLAHGDRMGNPCLFPRVFFPALMALPPDTGGKAVIRANPRRVTLVQAAYERELEDVDEKAQP